MWSPGVSTVKTDHERKDPMDEGQFDRFYTSSYSKLVGQIYAMCGNLALVTDVWVGGEGHAASG